MILTVIRRAPNGCNFASLPMLTEPGRCATLPPMTASESAAVSLRSRLIPVGLVITAALIPGFGTDRAAASPFPLRLADSLTHDFCFDASVPASPSVERQRMRDALSYLDDATDFSDLDGGTSCTSTRDVVFFYQSVILNDPNVRGYAPCWTWINSWVCGQAWVIVSPVAISAQSYGYGQLNYEINMVKTIRHEVGHTVGLFHDYADDCMISGRVPDDFKYMVYNSHNIAHINEY